MRTITLLLKEGVMGLELEGESGNLTSRDLHADKMSEEDIAFDGAIDGVEALVLAMACKGIDVTDPKMIASINDAIQAIENNL